MNCKKCGKKLRENALFCSECGERIENIEEMKLEFFVDNIDDDSTNDRSMQEVKCVNEDEKNGNENIHKKILQVVFAFGIIAVLFVTALMLSEKEAVGKKPENRVRVFIEGMEAGEYSKAYWDLKFPEGCLFSEETFIEFSEEYLADAEYGFDVETNELQIKTDAMTYNLAYKEDKEDWFLAADDLIMQHKFRCLSLIWKETSDRHWKLGRILNEEYIGNGLVEFTVVNFKRPEIVFQYCIEVGGDLDGTIFESSSPSVRAVLKVNEEGNFISIDGIYNACTGEILEGGNQLNGTIDGNVFTVQRYMFGPNYLDDVAEIPLEVLFDMAEDVMNKDRTFDEYQAANAESLANTDTLRAYYEYMDLVAERQKGIDDSILRADIFEVNQYTYSWLYYLGNTYNMTIDVTLFRKNRYKVDESTFEASFVPGEYKFILTEITEH